MYNETDIDIILDHFKTDINTMKNSPIILSWALENNKEDALKHFETDAWTEENIAIYLNNYRPKKIPNGLQNSEIVLSYCLFNEYFDILNDFLDSAWTDKNIKIIESQIYLDVFPIEKFPIRLLFDSRLLKFCLENKFSQYISVFLNNAWTDDNINLLIDVLLSDENPLENIPQRNIY